jgi:hypothetical protein
MAIKLINQEDYTLPNIQLYIVDYLKSLEMPIEDATKISEVIIKNLDKKEEVTDSVEV